MGMSDKDFAKVKFNLVNKSLETRAIEDGLCFFCETFNNPKDDILADLEFTTFDFIGLDHLDKSSRAGRGGSMEKAIKIFASFLFAVVLTFDRIKSKGHWQIAI